MDDVIKLLNHADIDEEEWIRLMQRLKGKNPFAISQIS